MLFFKGFGPHCVFTYPSLPTPIFSTIHQMNWKLIMQCSFFRLRATAGSLIISLVLLCLSYKWNKHTKQNLSIKLCMKYRNLLLNLKLCTSLFQRKRQLIRKIGQPYCIKKTETETSRLRIPVWYTNKITIIDFTIYSRLLCTKNKNSEFTV